MPLTAEELTRTHHETLAPGKVMIRKAVHPIFEELQVACQGGDLDDLCRVLDQILPFPEHVDGIVIRSIAFSLKAAVENRHGEVVSKLLRSGFVSYEYCYYGIKVAFHARDFDMLQVFSGAGWDVNETGPDNRMRPILSHAVSDDEMRRFLLSNGASPNVENQDGVTPLETAVCCASTEALKELLEHDGDPSKDDSLGFAVCYNLVQKARLLLEHGADIHARSKPEPSLPLENQNLPSPLSRAIKLNNNKLVELLLQEGRQTASSLPQLQSAIGLSDALVEKRGTKDSRIKKLLEDCVKQHVESLCKACVETTAMESGTAIDR